VTVFWDVVPRSLLESDRRFRGPYCLHFKHPWDAIQFMWDYTSQHLRRRSSLWSNCVAAAPCSV